MKNQYYRQLRLDLDLDHDQVGHLVDRLRIIVEDPDTSLDEKKRLRRLIRTLKALHRIVSKEVSPKIPISRRFEADPPPWLTG